MVAGAASIKGKDLTTWSVLPGGNEISLDFVSIDGCAHSLVLSADALSGLMMTLPRMLQAALDERFPDGSFRYVQWLGNWELEQQRDGAGLILKLATKDGFEATFALSAEHAGSLGAALSRAPSDIESTVVRRLN